MPNSSTQSTKLRNSHDTPKAPPQVPLDADNGPPPEPELPKEPEPVFEANSLAEVEAMRKRYREEREKREQRNRERLRKRKEQVNAMEESKEETQTQTHPKKNERESKQRKESKKEEGKEEETSRNKGVENKNPNKPWWEEVKEIIEGHPHQWRKEHIRKRAPCIVCGNPIHGHGVNGYVCKNCNSPVHIRCSSKAGECAEDEGS